MNLKQLIDLYISEILPRKRPQTQVKQTQQLAFWSKHLGKKDIKKIKPIDIIQARNKLEVSDASKNIYMAALRHVFSVGMREFDVVDVNPLSKISNLKNPRGRVRFLSDEERKQLMISCEESGNLYLYAVVLLAITTGARKNEIMSLKWADIDFDKNIVYLHETKNGETRTLILTEKVKWILFGFFRESRSEFVFRGKKEQPIDIRYPFNAALKRAGITNFRFHDLRHSCASYLAMNGASMNEIAEILGHKSLTMVKRYAHLSTAHKASVVNSMVDKIKL